MRKLLRVTLFTLLATGQSAIGQVTLPPSGDPLIDNLRMVEIQIYQFNEERKFAERWNLERKVEMRYGRQITKALEQASHTLMNRLHTISNEFGKFGRTLESTEPLREAVTRYRTYSRLMKFSGETNNSLLQIQEIAPNYRPGGKSTQIRLLRNGKSVGELDGQILEFLRRADVLGPAEFKPNSGNYIREYDLIQPRAKAPSLPGRFEPNIYEPDKDITGGVQ